MIAVLRIIRNERKDIFGRIKDLLPPKTTTQLSLTGGTLFVDIKQYINRHEINWQKLRSATSINEWLLPSGAIPPKECGIVDFKPKKLPQKLLAKTAEKVIEASDIKPSQMCLGLCLDDETEWFTEIAVEHSKEVRIFTKENAEEKSEYYLKKYGAALIVSENEDILSPCSVIVAPAQEKLTIAAESAFLFSPSKNRCLMRVEGAKVKAEPAFRELAKYYGDMRLLSALYELDGRREIASMPVNEAVTNYGILSVKEIANALRRGI